MNLYLERKGSRIGTWTIVDATILAAPWSTKNSSGERDPKMHQTRKGEQWYLGAKAHIGVDAKECHVHSVCTSAASVSDVHLLPDLLHGEEKKVWGDGGYQGQTETIRAVAPETQDMTCRWAPSFTYTIPGLTPGVTYAVRLHFAELTWTAAGQRVFNVAINGTTVLSDFDIFATAGA